MSDSSIKVTPGTGTDPDVATDTLADGRRAQQIKLLDGTDGSENKAIVTSAGALKVDASGATVPVSFAGGVSVNNAGGAAAVNVQDGGNSLTVDGAVTANIGTAGSLALDATLTGGAQKTKLVDSGGSNVAAVSAAGALKVDNSAVTQPVSGAVTANIGTSGSLALDATLTGGAQKTKIVDSGGSNVAAVSASGAVKVDGSAVTQPVSISGNQAVNVAQINGAAPLMGAGATGTGSHRVTIATDGQGQLADNAGFTDGTTRVDMAGFIFDETAGTALSENDAAAARIDSKRAQVLVLEDATTRGQRAAITASGAVKVDLSATAANATGVKVDGSAVTQPVSGAVGLAPATSGGCSISRTLSAASTNATSVKASAGQVFGVRAFNANAATRYLKLYNKSSAPTVGTDTPVDTIPLPSGTTTGFMLDSGVAFGTGIAFALTTGIADSDTGAVAANDIEVTIFYK